MNYHQVELMLKTIMTKSITIQVNKISKAIYHNYFKPLLWCTAVLFYTNGFSQSSQIKTNSPKNALALSDSHSKKASWFTDMPQYNKDSAAFYSDKALKVLDAKEPLHQTKFLRLQFEKMKNSDNKFSLSVKDSLTEIAWNKVKDLNRDKEENKLLLFDYLAYWSDIKMSKGDRPTSLDLFTKAISILETNKDLETQAKIDLHKGLFYAKYGLPEEKQFSIDNLHRSLQYYENAEVDENLTELYMIYAQLIYQYAGTSQDSTKVYYDRLKTLLKVYKKPLAHIWYYNMYSFDLVQQAVADKEGVNGKNYEEARVNISKAMEILTTYDMQSTSFYPYFFSLLADIDFYTSNFDSALNNYKKAYDLYKEMNEVYYSTYQLKNMSDTYKEMGDYENALKFQEQYSDESLRLEKEKNERSLRENVLQLDLLTQEKSLSRKQSQQSILLVVLAIGTIILVLIYRNFRLKQSSNLKLGKVNKELNIKNKQNELLLKEIHHRVKNNLELVKSLLALQSAQLEESATKDAMIASQNRVQSMGIIHQKLYQGENLGSIEMKDYFLNLGEGILDTFNAEDKVKIECAMENLELDVDTAVPIGLIVNELLTNALKYAFPKDGKGNIMISLAQSTPETLTLKVADNGVGKVVGLAPKGTGFGSQLIQLLTQQLNGMMLETNQDGTSVEFQFKIKSAA